VQHCTPFLFLQWQQRRVSDEYLLHCLNRSLLVHACTENSARRTPCTEYLSKRAALCCHLWHTHNSSHREQQRSWLYRIRPSVTHEPFHPLNFPAEQLTADFSLGVVTPNQVSIGSTEHTLAATVQLDPPLCSSEQTLRLGRVLFWLVTAARVVERVACVLGGVCRWHALSFCFATVFYKARCRSTAACSVVFAALPWPALHRLCSAALAPAAYPSRAS
jgi:hypothetical protein